MPRLTMVAICFGVCSLAGAQTLTLGEVKAKNAVRLSAEDLQQLLPGAKVMSRVADGSIRRWENKPDGTLVASSDSSGSLGGKAYRVTGSGTWRIDDRGRFCVSIKWNIRNEDVCRFIFKADGKYYGTFKLEDSAPMGEFEFSK
jgi:Protein of unknown function (DUF995)